MKTESAIVDELVSLLRKGNAHASLDDALDGIPIEKINIRVDNLPYSVWELADHIRISQWDIVEFCKDPTHVSPQWPSGYWPSNKKPTEKEWKKCLNDINEDRERMISLLKTAGSKLFETFPYGSGQSLFREALVLADHNSYHTGEIIVLRRLLGIWK
jgi:hypothetical protein